MEPDRAAFAEGTGATRLDLGKCRGRLPVLPSVRQAEAALLEHIGPRPYLPMEGLADFRTAVQSLPFGAGHEAVTSGRLATLQTLGGSGGLKVGADFLRRYFPEASLWVSDPTWDNHQAIFEGAGFEVRRYPYYDPITGGLRFDDMLATLDSLPRHSIVLLHASCHNPTGVDFSAAQWQALIPVLRDRALIPFIDIAYQGFGDGLDEDAFALRELADEGIQFFVANFFQELLDVRRALRRPQRGVQRTPDSRHRAWATQGRRPAQLLDTPHARRARDRPRAARPTAVHAVDR